MSSPHGQPTRVQPPAPAPPAPKASSELDLKTLVITAVASALAATICSKVWAPGTLVSAAFTPVVVALCREAVRRPTEAVAAVLPVPRRGGTQDLSALPRETPLASSDPTRVHRAGAAVPGPQEDPTRVTPGAAHPERPVGAEPVTVYSVSKPRRHRWRIAAITGLLGFVVAAVVVTVPELVAGKEQTTFFNPPAKKASKKDVPPATTTTKTTETEPTETVTTTKTETVPEESTTTTAPGTATTPEGTGTATTTTTTPSTPATPATPETPGATDGSGAAGTAGGAGATGSGTSGGATP
ncbi:hypothetical protein [Patulibacter americanus]|uniref:hypothetical protein n=1 Tax=Patulibacter americanus TaxID=588672 RepID=UPI00041BF5E2|nr:hypothetical protein [Patulibacter americanus]